MPRRALPADEKAARRKASLERYVKSDKGKAGKQRELIAQRKRRADKCAQGRNGSPTSTVSPPVAPLSPSSQLVSDSPSYGAPSPAEPATLSSALTLPLPVINPPPESSTSTPSDVAAAAQKLWEDRREELRESQRKASHKYHHSIKGQVRTIRQVVYRRVDAPRDPAGFQAAVDAVVREKLGEEGVAYWPWLAETSV